MEHGQGLAVHAVVSLICTLQATSTLHPTRHSFVCAVFGIEQAQVVALKVRELLFRRVSRSQAPRENDLANHFRSRK
jgi:hypothetical protein